MKKNKILIDIYLLKKAESILRGEKILSKNQKQAIKDRLKEKQNELDKDKRG